MRYTGIVAVVVVLACLAGSAQAQVVLDPDVSGIVGRWSPAGSPTVLSTFANYGSIGQWGLNPSYQVDVHGVIEFDMTGQKKASAATLQIAGQRNTYGWFGYLQVYAMTGSNEDGALTKDDHPSLASNTGPIWSYYIGFTSFNTFEVNVTGAFNDDVGTDWTGYIVSFTGADYELYVADSNQPSLTLMVTEAVPLPAASGLGAIGLLSLFFAHRIRRRKQKTTVEY